MAKRVKLFFAYQSEPPALGEAIENALVQLNSTGLVDAQSWKKLGVPGKLIVHEVCKAIEASDIVACDLTYLNSNVLFELGYAVAKNKRVWIVVDPTINHSSDRYRSIGFLSGIGYAQYRNDYELVAAFLNSQPLEELDTSVYRAALHSASQSQRRRAALLYLKSEHPTSASTRLSQLLADSRISLITDDPSESPNQTLSWYAHSIEDTFGVLAHLIDEQRTSSLYQNEKYSFVCGLAFGLGKPVLMLAHAPFSPPLDYRELLTIHATAAECLRAVNLWLPSIQAKVAETRRKEQVFHEETHGVTTLQKVYLGEHIAENEEEDLL